MRGGAWKSMREKGSGCNHRQEEKLVGTNKREVHIDGRNTGGSGKWKTE